MSEIQPSNGRRRKRATGGYSTVEMADCEQHSLSHDDADDQKDHRYHDNRWISMLRRKILDHQRGLAAFARKHALGEAREEAWISVHSISLQEIKTFLIRNKREASALLICFFVYVTIFQRRSTFSTRHFDLRPWTDDDANKLPIALKYLDFSSIKTDIGGWTYQSGPRYIPSPTKALLHDTSADHAELDVSAPLFNFSRHIRLDDYERYEEIRKRELDAYDLTQEPQRYWHDDELEDMNTTCRRPNWFSIYRTTCNNFHAMPIDRDYDSALAHREGYEEDIDLYYINHGFYRDVWLVDDTLFQTKVILKTSRYEHPFKFLNMYATQLDSLVMERLTSAENIVDIYGLCGVSMLVEAVPFEVEEYVVPGDGYMKPGHLNDTYGVNPQNRFNATEKLQMALEMAESIAMLHGFEGGVIVHDDIQMCQWLRTREGKLKLGDFNRAEIRLWNDAKHEYCKHNNGLGYGNYRSPEEFSGRDLDEQIDVFSFGNNLYGLLTGLWVYYENRDDTVVQQKITSAQKPYVDDRYRTGSYAEGKLVEVMEKCWHFEPEKRITIFDAVRILREAVTENERRQKSGT